MAPSLQTSYNALYMASFSLAATTFVIGITWGVMTSLYAVCMYSLIRELRSGKATKRTAILTAWITILWVFSSICSISNAYCSIYAYSWEMDYPGGPSTYLADEWNAPIPLLASSAYIVTMGLADALMLWRVFIFCHGLRPLTRGVVLFFMFLIYIGVVGTACFMIVIASSNETVYSKLGMRAAIPCFTLSVTLNVLSTAFITTRLLMFKRQIDSALDCKEVGTSLYTSVATIIIESSALYAVWSVVFIIVYSLDTAGQYIMLMTLCNVQVIAPVLIVYRVSKGMGWEQTTSERLMATDTRMIFAEGATKSVVVCDPEHQKGSDSDLTMGFFDPSQDGSNASSRE